MDWLAAERAELEFDRPRLLPGLNGYAGVAACMTSIGAEKMTQNTVGVDISKHWLDAHRLIDGASRRFNNNRAGRKALIAWARRPGPDPRLAFEPSGGCHRELEQALDQAGAAAVKINPLQARRFAEAIGTRAKTDAVDARVLARMAAVLELQATPAPTEIMRQLKELLVARRALIKDQTAAGARANSLISPLLKRLSGARRRHLEAQLQAVEAEIDALIGADPGLAARRDILMSIPGISDVTATALLIEAPELGSARGRPGRQPRRPRPDDPAIRPVERPSRHQRRPRPAAPRALHARPGRRPLQPRPQDHLRPPHRRRKTTQTRPHRPDAKARHPRQRPLARWQKMDAQYRLD